MRPYGRAADALRTIEIETGVSPYAEGSCLIKCGNTHVLCTASVEENVPPWMRNSGKGWVTAEYGMLPRATHTRGRREAAAGKQSGRTQEIQRLIGRSLRAVVDLRKLGERQITLDCDVIQADGGTRTAAITGAWVALSRACNWLVEEGVLDVSPVHGQIAAVSCGLVGGEARLDLEYEEDRVAETDANFVLTDDGGVVEIQATAEDKPMPASAFDDLFTLARKGVKELVGIQRSAIG
ncbi:ribonuclease PH [Hyphobacterium marinum]|uniref:Ribonuclease PH n=1 Tax=Hyphobacterium marinum TaxID=3116574 RepID=A0ABU7LVW7_9PROT|nr:ribonuclease PH [Hyphobacterium sp. Y6023]MEE2565412.1 ribonuclease PH [Hyphobacterium sp. Y6023]